MSGQKDDIPILGNKWTPCWFFFSLKIMRQTKHAWLSKNFLWNRNSKIKISEYLCKHMIAHRTKQMHVISTSTPDRQWKLPFGREFGSLCGRRALGARKPPSSPLKVSRTSSELKRGSLPGVPAASPIIWCICLSNPGAQKPCSAPTAAFSSEWSRHLLSRLASSHTCTPVCPELGLPWNLSFSCLVSSFSLPNTNLWISM